MTIMVAGMAKNDVSAAFAIYGSGNYDLGSAFQNDLNKLPRDQAKRGCEYLMPETTLPA